MDGGDDLIFGVDEEDGYAVSGGDAEGDERNFCDEGICVRCIAWFASPRFATRYDADAVRMDLVCEQESGGRDVEVLGDEESIVADVFGVVFDEKGGVESLAWVEAQSAFSGEEGVSCGDEGRCEMREFGVCTHGWGKRWCEGRVRGVFVSFFC